MAWGQVGDGLFGPYNLIDQRMGKSKEVGWGGVELVA